MESNSICVHIIILECFFKVNLIYVLQTNKIWIGSQKIPHNFNANLKVCFPKVRMILISSRSYGRPQSRGSAERTADGPQALSRIFWDIWQGLDTPPNFCSMTSWGDFIASRGSKKANNCTWLHQLLKMTISVLVALNPQFRETFWAKKSREIETKLSEGNLIPEKAKVAQSCLTLCDPMDYTVHGILQARILEGVAFPFFRGSSQSRDWIQVSLIAGGFFTSWEETKPWRFFPFSICRQKNGWELKRVRVATLI